MGDKIMVNAGDIGTTPSGSPAGGGGGGTPPTPAPTLKEQEMALMNTPIGELDKSLAARNREEAGPDPEDEPAAAEPDAGEPLEAEPTEETNPDGTPKVPEAPDETEVFESEKAFLEAQGIKDHESLSGYIQDQQKDVADLMEVFKLAGMPPERIPNNLKDLTALLMQEVAAKAMNGDAPPEPEPVEAAPAPVNLEGFFKKHEDKLDPAYLPLYQEMAQVIATQLRAEMPKAKEVDTDIDPGHLGFELMLYNDEVQRAAKENRPVPSFSEARNLVRAQKGSMATYRFFAGKVGNPKNSPYATAFQTFAASKAPGGITKAQEAKTVAGAKKVMIAKSMLSPTPASRPKAKSFSELSKSEQTKALDNMPA